MKRREATAPQYPLDVVMDRIDKLQKLVHIMQQTGPSSLQADDWEEAVSPTPWEVMLHGPGRHAPAFPYDTAVYHHPGYVNPETGEITPEGWKALSSVSVYAPKVFSDERANKVLDGAFRFPIHRRHDGAKVRAVMIYNGTVGSGATTCQFVNTTRGINLLTGVATIPGGEFTSYSAADPVINEGGNPLNPNNKVYEGDMIWCNVLSIGAGSKGLGFYMDVA